MTRRMHELPRLLCVVLAVALAPVVAQAAGKITGTISSRDRTAFPPQAVVLVSLRDVSLADAPAEEISSIELRPKHQPPLPFDLRYDPRRIRPAHTYAVSARVSVDGRLAFISTRMYPVITRGAARRVEIVVDPVGGPRN
jgi:putative lipoprotein